MRRWWRAEGLAVVNFAIVGVLAGVCAAQPGAEHDGSGGAGRPKEAGAAGGARDGAAGNPHSKGGSSAAAAAPLDWKTLEAPLLTEHVQLTTRDKFVKAGEAYFDHNTPPRWVVFQAVPVPEKGKEPDGFYGMYVAKLKYDGGKIVGIEEPVKISPEGSANTCGWFHPTEPAAVIFGSTLKKPEAKERPGFQVGTNRYVWQFPPEMEIVETVVSRIVDDQRFQKKWIGTFDQAATAFERKNYDAECSYSKDARFILYAHVRDEATRGKDDADIWVYDIKTEKHHEIVKADGYDGGPFFSPDGKRICYRSDREGNDKLQLFVADLKLDADGVPVGIEREYPVTANEHVNWAPFWHPSGKFLVYGTSAMGHSNYEVFAVEVPEAADGAKKAGELRSRRITSANGADVLPVFSDDGQWMMWTAQRGAMVEGESKPSSQVWVAHVSQSVTDHSRLFGPESKKLSGKEARAKIVALLTQQEESQSGTRPYDLSQLKVERITEGWRAIINPNNAVDGTQCIFVLDNDRVLHGYLNGIGGSKRGQELSRLLALPILSDENETLAAGPSPAGPVVLTREQATQRMIALLRAREAEGKARMPAGGHYPDYDLSKLNVVRINGGWSGRVNPWNVPDGETCVLVLDDGRTFQLSTFAPYASNEIADLMSLPAIPDP